MLDTDTGEIVERTLEHEHGEARRFYEALRGQRVRVGIEATGNSLWFELMLEEMGHELWLGDPAKIRAAEPRKQKNDRRDAQLVLRLLAENRFPRIWVPTPAMREARQLLVHRHKLVQMRARVKNQLQHVALNHGLRRKNTLWSAEGRELLQRLPLSGWTARRRADLLELLDALDPKIAVLDQAVEEEARHYPDAVLLQTHAGVGPNTALAYALTVGPVERFERAKKLTSYLGLIPSEHSSGRRRSLGAITKQGNTFMRALLVEAGQSAARCDPELRRAYQRLLARKKHRGVAKVMIARKLAVRMYWILRTRQPYRPLACRAARVIP